ncbi:hypothetical protein KCTC32516_02318 [Polaribacter huanghezhanensis]|uniref:hypothetical protein n=1 Tax=Polaribacter huanghezhanensis TaxID=1354726 RepID=UPI002647B6E7|nr:hypothetical protein [Polaribacter huanghezhanensis]WKD86938.1 hypothetical protein KCTC32516_02318 [Polaribacter huanghezhanensis]
MKEHLTLLIDDKNIDLWNELNNIYKIELIASPEGIYSSNVSSKTATISINEEDLSAISFTHQLIHLSLKSKNVKIAEDFYTALEKNERINSLFSDGLKEHVTYCLELELTRPLFLKMGYENQLITSDFNEPKMNKKMLDILFKRYTNKNVYDREAVDFFIGTFFAMKSCNNPAFKYHKYFIAFQDLDKELYTLLSEFWLDWKTYDMEDIEDSYDKILQYFIEDLTRWISEKTIS